MVCASQQRPDHRHQHDRRRAHGLQCIGGADLRWALFDHPSSIHRRQQVHPTELSGSVTNGYISQGGLTWSPANVQLGWASASSYCPGTINGTTGWRLPTQTELANLINSHVLNGNMDGRFASPGHRPRAAEVSTSAPTPQQPLLHRTPSQRATAAKSPACSEI